MQSSAVVVAKNLTKRFGDRVAVAGIEFAIELGECFGFLGPNGAGKTSTMRMIYGASPRSDGVLNVLGHDIERDGAAVKRWIGVVPQDDNLDEELTVAENLEIYASFFGLPRHGVATRIDELLELFELAARRSSEVRSLSGGMRRRLLIARGLVHSPRLLVLDEPTTALDPQARHLVWEKLRILQREGVTLALTTHYMDEAEQLCDRLVVMDRGMIIARGSPRDLIDALMAGDPNYAAMQRRATLEDVFLKLTGRELIEP